MTSRRAQTLLSDETYDYIVIGAGPAGCAVAARLADAPDRPRVALVEQGPPKAPFLSVLPVGIAGLVPWRSRYNYAYLTAPQAELDGRRGYVPRGRGLGGSSLINAMIAIRGQRRDYDDWAAAGCTGWGWDDVLPYFRRSETNSRGGSELRGADGPLHVSDLVHSNDTSRAFIDAAARCGYPRNDDFNGADQEGVGFYQLFQKGGRRLDAGSAYIGATPRANLSLIADTGVSRILFDGPRAVGVETGGGRRQVRTFRARREVVLSAGAIGSPQLLMLSGIGPAAELGRHGIAVRQDAAGVGANLQDHVDYVVNAKMRAAGLVGMGLSTLLRAVGAWGDYRRGGGWLTSNIVEAGGFVRSGPDVDRPDLQLHFGIAMVDDHNRKMHIGTGVSLHACVLRPESRGTVTLAGPDPTAMPIIDPRFLSAAADRKTLLRGARIARVILAEMTGSRTRLLHGSGRESDAELMALIRAHADTIYHPVGTCRMGSDDASVVDPALRVRGTSALRVVDASIMPTLISGNTQAPSAMIGERAADLILKDAA